MKSAEERDRLTAIHNLPNAHGCAVQTLRETVPDAEIGFAPCSGVVCPADTDKETAALAGKRYFSCEKDDKRMRSVFSAFAIGKTRHPGDPFENAHEVRGIVVAQRCGDGFHRLIGRLQ